jgi:hypothetical protein
MITLLQGMRVQRPLASFGNGLEDRKFRTILLSAVQKVRLNPGQKISSFVLPETYLLPLNIKTEIKQHVILSVKKDKGGHISWSSNKETDQRWHFPCSSKRFGKKRMESLRHKVVSWICHFPFTLQQRITFWMLHFRLQATFTEHGST